MDINCDWTDAEAYNCEVVIFGFFLVNRWYKQSFIQQHHFIQYSFRLVGPTVIKQLVYLVEGLFSGSWWGYAFDFLFHQSSFSLSSKCHDFWELKCKSICYKHHKIMWPMFTFATSFFFCDWFHDFYSQINPKYHLLKDA